MSILTNLSLTGNGETEPKRWGSYEALPTPAQQRVRIVMTATRAVASCSVVQASNSDRSQSQAAQVIDEVLSPEIPIANNFATPASALNSVPTAHGDVKFTEAQTMGNAARQIISQHHADQTGANNA